MQDPVPDGHVVTSEVVLVDGIAEETCLGDPEEQFSGTQFAPFAIEILVYCRIAVGWRERDSHPRHPTHIHGRNR